MASPVFKTGVTRLSRAGWVRFLHAPASAALLAFAVIVAVGAPVAAQAPDTLRSPVPARIDTVLMDTLARIDTARAPVTQATLAPGRPISPGGAFLQSLLIPSRGQITLGKRSAAGFYIAVEALGIGMTIKSMAALREAKRGVGDSIPVEFEVDSITGDSIPTAWEPGRFTPERVNARRTHVEDWVALIIFNHLLSAADAYVAANLWDFPASVSVKARPAPAHARTDGRGPPLSSLNLEARITGSIAW